MLDFMFRSNILDSDAAVFQETGITEMGYNKKHFMTSYCNDFMNVTRKRHDYSFFLWNNNFAVVMFFHYVLLHTN